MSEETVVVRISARGYFRGGRQYHGGELLEVPRSALPKILDSSPPRGEVVEDLEAATRPPGPDMTDTARSLLEDAAVDPASYDGPASGKDGRVLAGDARAWLQEQQEGE